MDRDGADRVHVHVHGAVPLLANPSHATLPFWGF
jgi:hypothetical protein